MDSNNLDKYFRDQLNNREVPYRPEDWANMADYLDKHPISYRKKMSKRRVLLPLGLLSLLVAGFLLPRNQAFMAPEEKATLGPVHLRSIPASLETNPKTERDGYAFEASTQDSHQSSPSLGLIKEGKSNNSNHSLAIETGTEPSASVYAATDLTLALVKSLDQSGQASVSERTDQSLQLLNNLPPVALMPGEEQDLDVQSLSIQEKIPLRAKRKAALEMYVGLGFIESPNHPVYRVGISGKVHWNHLFFMRTGLAFSSQHTHPHAGYVFEKKRYYLGVNSTFYEMEVDKALSLSIPLDLGLKKGRHSFLAGLELEQILASRGSFIEKSSGEGAQILTEGWIVDADILPHRWVNYAVGYEYLLNPKISLGFRLERALYNTAHREGDVLKSSPLSSAWGRGMVQLRINM
jgi:hypothetical protein